MSGRVPPSSRATGRAAAASADDIERAALQYEAFTGHDALALGSVWIPPVPKVLTVFGELDAVEYTTVRDGAEERYRHKFRAADKPLIAVTPDGLQLVLVGGRYAFTEAGIVDRSDRANWRRYVEK